MQEVTTDSSNIIKGYFEKYVKMSKERKLNTDGKTTYNILKNRIEVNNEVIDYDNDNHRLYFLNKIISNLNSQFIDFMALPKECCPYIILNSNGDSITGTASLSWIRSRII